MGGSKIEKKLKIINDGGPFIYNICQAGFDFYTGIEDHIQKKHKFHRLCGDWKCSWVINLKIGEDKHHQHQTRYFKQNLTTEDLIRRPGSLAEEQD